MHAIKLSHLKYIVYWVLVNLYSYVTITITSSKTVLSPPPKIHYTIYCLVLLIWGLYANGKQILGCLKLLREKYKYRMQ